MGGWVYDGCMCLGEKQRERLIDARHVVVKFGTQLLSDDGGGLSMEVMGRLAGQIAGLVRMGKRVTLVSSGAVGAGLSELNLKGKARGVGVLQAVAAVGQRCLMDALAGAFGAYGMGVGQLLMTRSDFDDRVRYLNFRNCVTQLHGLGCLPIINENDTVAVEELRFGDNDQLAALACQALNADCLVLLTVVEGLLDAHGVRVGVVEDLEGAMVHVRDECSALGTGGMGSKLASMGLVTRGGDVGVIASGRADDILLDIFKGKDRGTLFLPGGKGERLNSKRRWLGLAKRPGGRVVVDDGAKGALLGRGKSLLAIGVLDCWGDFGAGDLVTVEDVGGREIARGLSNYSGEEIRLIKGKRSEDLAGLLGVKGYHEVIHRDHLVITDELS